MPFAMIHLSIAKNIIENRDEIVEPHQFMLGAISPDAVHYLDGYHSGMKSKSHYCVGDERWGCVTNNEEWIENVIRNIDKYKNHKNRDFYLGYFTHILTDIQNNMKVWQPFKECVKDSKEEGIGRRYHEESETIDIWLHQRSNDDIRNLIDTSYGIDIGDIGKDEIEEMKIEFVNARCIEAKAAKVDISEHEYVKLEEVDQFIEEVSEYIEKLMFA